MLMLLSNFHRLSIKTTGFSFSRFKNSKKKNILDESKSGLNDDKIRDLMGKKPLFNLIVRTVNFILNLFKIGDSLKAYYLKEN